MQGLLPPYTSRFDVVGAYYLIASRYHSGQSSRGYNRLCVAGKHLGGNIDGLLREESTREHAAALLRKRKAEIKRMW